MFDKLKNLTPEQHEEYKKMLQYLTSLDLQKEIDIVGISRLSLELTDHEDEVLLTSGKNTAFKILKIVLF